MAEHSTTALLKLFKCCPIVHFYWLSTTVLSLHGELDLGNQSCWQMAGQNQLFIFA